MKTIQTREDIKKTFYPVAPASLTLGQKQSLELFQQRTAEYAEEVLEYVPEGSDRTYIMRLILQAKLFGVQAITHTTPVIKESTSTNLGFGKVLPATHGSDGSTKAGAVYGANTETKAP